MNRVEDFFQFIVTHQQELMDQTVEHLGLTAVALTIVLLLSGLRMLPQRQETWLWLLLLALGPQIVGHSALNWALRYLSATYVTIAVLGEPIGATLLAWWLLGELPSYWAVGGGALIFVGIVVASRAERIQDG